MQSLWYAAGVVAIMLSPKHAVLALFVGGMFIHPVGILIAKVLGRPGAHTRGNPLGTLALDSTVLMLLCLPLAYAISVDRPDWFFPAMLLVIGGRYLVFRTIYGARVYWLLGASLASAAFALVALRASPIAGAFVGAGGRTGARDRDLRRFAAWRLTRYSKINRAIGAVGIAR
jgi:hypothetical protein